MDIPVDLSMQRAETRHRAGYEDFLAGRGLGGRHVPAEVIASRADPDWGSQNRRNFEQVKHKFDAWSLYDNSVDGRRAVLVATNEADFRERSIEAE